MSKHIEHKKPCIPPDQKDVTQTEVLNTLQGKHLYSFNYDHGEDTLCILESKYLFDQEPTDKLLVSDKKMPPSISPFIKSRLDITVTSENYTEFIGTIKKKGIQQEGFKVEYLVLKGDETGYNQRLSKLKDIGYRIEGFPDYYYPTKTYGIGYFHGKWCFGELIKSTYSRDTHKQKLHSYSNSINISIAKSLVNIASKGDTSKKLLDACCGVGTILLEACYSGFQIEGCDINRKICNDARANLELYGYQTKVHHSDIGQITEKYDAAILDLPYNLFSTATDSDILHILQSSLKIAPHLVIVSIADISEQLNAAQLRIVDHCNVQKTRKRNFTRKVWVCKKS